MQKQRRGASQCVQVCVTCSFGAGPPGAWELERGKKFKVQGRVPILHSPTQGLPSSGKSSSCPYLSPGNSCCRASCHCSAQAEDTFSLNFLSFMGRDPFKQPPILSFQGVFPASRPLAQ